MIEATDMYKAFNNNDNILTDIKPTVSGDDFPYFNAKKKPITQFSDEYNKLMSMQ